MSGSELSECPGEDSGLSREQGLKGKPGGSVVRMHENRRKPGSPHSSRGERVEEEITGSREEL